MRFVVFSTESQGPAVGLLHHGSVIRLERIAKAERDPAPPTTLEALIENAKDWRHVVAGYDRKLKAGEYRELGLPISAVKLHAPIQRPASLRDAYAFRQHVATARRNRGVEMIPEFDQFPVFYFTNKDAVQGPGPIHLMPDHFQRLDFELEVAIVTHGTPRNVRAAEADSFVFGYMIYNDLSARALQMDEMLLSLGPAKGKDFANILGPILVTPDELEAHRVPPPAGHEGALYNLKMSASINGAKVSDGNLAQMDWTFAEILERITYGVTLPPTSVIGSGTVGTGCLLELNGTAKLENPNAVPRWLQPGDTVTLEVQELGTLETQVLRDETAGDYSLLALKKQPN